MSPGAGSGGERSMGPPSMLDLVRLSPRLLFPPGGRELYRQIALLTGLSAGDEILVVGTGNGVTLEYFVTEYGAHGSGVDFDHLMVDVAGKRTRSQGLADRVQYQQAPLDRLPYRDEIFDVVVGELGLTARAAPGDALKELVRVTRPGGRVAVVQLVWKAPVDEARRRVLRAHLGVEPLMLVEWKRALKVAGLENLHTEDWTDEETAFRPRLAKPFPDFAELFSFPEKLGILRRAWRRWGWSGVRAALVREREVHRLLTHERILGLTLVSGVKPDAGSEVEAPVGTAPEEEQAAPEEEQAAPEEEQTASEERAAPGEERGQEAGETRGLPLFGGADENG